MVNNIEKNFILFEFDKSHFELKNKDLQDTLIETIENLKDKGSKVCLYTKDSLAQMSYILDKVKFDYYIVLNGACVLDKDFNLIDSEPMNNHLLKGLIDLCNKENYGLTLHFDNGETGIYNRPNKMQYFNDEKGFSGSIFIDSNQCYHNDHKVYGAIVYVDDRDKLKTYLSSQGVWVDSFAGIVDKDGIYINIKLSDMGDIILLMEKIGNINIIKQFEEANESFMYFKLD